MRRPRIGATLFTMLGALAGSACFDPSGVEDDTPMDTEATGGSTAARDDDGDDDDEGGDDDGATSSSPTSTSDASDPSGDPSGDPTGDPSGDPTGDTGPVVEACGAGETCVPEAPAGWSGPAVVYRGTEPPPSCPAAAPSLGFAANTDLVAPPAECTCECGEAQDFDCTTSVAANGSSCIAFCLGCGQWSLDAGQCSALSSGSTHFAVNTPVLDTSGASCDPSASQTVPPAAWGTHVQACDVPEGGLACDRGSCTGAIADPYDATCIYAEGDATCPDGPYTEREVVYTGVSDDRSCGDCSCGEPTGTCGGEVQFASGCSGLQQLYAIVDVGTCANVGTQHDVISYSPNPDVSCAPQGGQAMGDAVGSGPITMCCVP